MKSYYVYIKYGLFAISISILVYFSFTTINNLNQLPNILGQNAAPSINNIPQLINNGIALAAQGNYNGAISFYDKVLSLNSTNAKALKGKSDVQAKLDKQKGTTISPNIAPTTPTNSIQ
jgi:tetratricopeptide (TPR) repeat protein